MRYQQYEVTAYFHSGGSLFLGAYEAFCAGDAEEKAVLMNEDMEELQGTDYQLEAVPFED